MPLPYTHQNKLTYYWNLLNTPTCNQTNKNFLIGQLIYRGDLWIYEKSDIGVIESTDPRCLNLSLNTRSTKSTLHCNVSFNSWSSNTLLRSQARSSQLRLHSGSSDCIIRSDSVGLDLCSDSGPPQGSLSLQSSGSQFSRKSRSSQGILGGNSFGGDFCFDAGSSEGSVCCDFCLDSGSSEGGFCGNSGGCDFSLDSATSENAFCFKGGEVAESRRDVRRVVGVVGHLKIIGW